MSKYKDDDSWYYRGIKRRDFRNGAVDENDYVGVVPRSKSKTKAKRAKAGCPGNDGGPHVYVWIDTMWQSMNKPYWWYLSGYQHKVCCGCEKRGKGWRRKP